MGITAAFVTAAATVYSADQARGAQNRAVDQAKANAARTAQQADQANNRANAKAPDVAALLSANQQAAAGGAGSTMLTGATGVDPRQLTLGRSTLLAG